MTNFKPSNAKNKIVFYINFMLIQNYAANLMSGSTFYIIALQKRRKKKYKLVKIR